MAETRYGLRVDVNMPYEEALDRITARLHKEGFGVLTTIDVRQTRSVQRAVREGDELAEGTD